MTSSVAVGLMLVADSASAQQRDAASVSTRYGVPTYDGRFLHPQGYQSAAVPVRMDDGRTGQFAIPQGRRDPHGPYYRDDQTGDSYPVQLDSWRPDSTPVGLRASLVPPVGAARHRSDATAGHRAAPGAPDSPRPGTRRHPAVGD